jgi:FHA domain
MPKLVLQFENTTLKEMFVGRSGVKIGRSPDNGMVIDNLAVSHHHARVFPGIEGRLMLEDFGSMNGTFVNGQRVKMVTLKAGDCVAIAKHRIFVEDSNEMDGLCMWKAPANPAAPKIDETFMLATKERADFLQRIAAEGEQSQIAPARLRIPTLFVRKGKTSHAEYLLTDQLTVIGKSELAGIRLRGWFAPWTAAQINRRGDNSFYLGAAGKIPSINGHPAIHPAKLAPGDVIEVAGVRLEFQFRD